MSDDLFAALAAPFPPDRISWRVGSMNKDKTKAMALAYIDARDVMGRFDDVCGPAGWERRHPHVDKTTTCEISVWIEGRGWVVKADGAGDTQVEAEKGSLSDAFKRAAVNWGVGRYLYSLPSPWVEIDEYKRIKATELPKLRALLTRDAAASAPKAETPRAETKRLAPANGAAPISLKDRASALETAMRGCKTRADLRRIYAKGSGLCADLDMKDPERLTDIEGLYQTLFDKLPEEPTADAFGLNGDDIQQFA